MQKEKTNRPFLKYWKSIRDALLQKAIESQNKDIGRLLFFRVNNSNAFVLREILPYVFPGFSIIFIGYIIIYFN